MNQEMPHPGAQSLTQAYVICTSPRSGSYLLCEALEGTGLLGRPREYFDGDKGKEKWWIDRLGITSDDEYVGKVIAAGSMPNGVFGLKLFWYQIPDLVSRFDKLRQSGTNRISRPFSDILAERFNNSVAYIWLRRKNTVAQAISYYRAEKTGVWHARPRSDKSAKTPGFEFAEINRRVLELQEYERCWHRFFVQLKIRALVVNYEDFVADNDAYERTVRTICGYLGVEADQVHVCPPRFRKQADVTSLEWEQEYRKRVNGSGGAAPPRSRMVASVRPAAAAARPAAANAMVRLPRVPADRKISAVAEAPAADPGTGELPIIAYDVSPQLAVGICNASPRRAWMDAMPERHAYRCLPLVIANQYGWLLLNPIRFTAVWSGQTGLDAVVIKYPAGVSVPVATSHFGAGIVTFATKFIFRTPAGVNLLVRGPANMPKDGVSPLEGIVETDWSEATFTMNWQITRPNYPVEFEKDEPFAMVTPINRGDIERYTPEIRLISSNPELELGYGEWSRSRDAFNRDLKIKNSAAQKARWQRHYVRGETVTQNKAREHQTAVALRDFTDKRK